LPVKLNYNFFVVSHGCKTVVEIQMIKADNFLFWRIKTEMEWSN